jgi:TetR/AcrR family acrAB operon transcriptional repressor
MPGKRRKSRQLGAKGAETRRLLLEKAGELFETQGIEATTLDQIAAAAGVTKGAIYDHFANKTELVFELFEARGSPTLKALAEDRAPAQQLAALMEQLLSWFRPEMDYVSSHNEFNHYISSDPARSKRFGKLTQEYLADIAVRLEETVGAQRLPLTPIETAVAVGALRSGLLLNRLLAPDLVSDAIVSRIFERILGLDGR